MHLKTAFLWISVLFFLQIAAQPIFFDQTPPLVLIGIIFFALSGGPMVGLLTGALAGFLLDLLGTGPLGYEMVVFASAGAFCGFFSNILFRDGLVTQLFVPTAMNFMIQLCNLILFRHLYGRPVYWSVLKEAWDVSSFFLTLFLSPFLFAFLRSVTRSSSPRRVKARPQVRR